MATSKVDKVGSWLVGAMCTIALFVSVTALI
jgi:hypothetical protein